MDLPTLYQTRPLTLYQDGSLQTVVDPVVIETHLNLLVNDVEFATLVCSPEAYQELAVGYLLSEGILQTYEDLRSLSCDQEQRVVRVYTAEPLDLKKDECYRQINSCAGRGQKGLQTNSEGILRAAPKGIFTAEQLLGMLQILEQRGGTFRLTGGTHSAALGYEGDLLVSYEDIGRHNAVDKVFGAAFLQQIPLDDKCLVLSGRIASEILLKAARRHIPLVLSRSAATGLTVDLAEEMGITVVGFARGSRFNIYCHGERVKV